MEGQTRLLVVDKDTDEELRRRQLTCTEEMAQHGLPPTHDPWDPKPDWARASSLGPEAGPKVPQVLRGEHPDPSPNLPSAHLHKSLSPSLLPLGAPGATLLALWGPSLCPQPVFSARWVGAAWPWSPPPPPAVASPLPQGRSL